MIKRKVKEDLNKILKVDNFSISEPPPNIDFDFSTNILFSLSKKNRKTPIEIFNKILPKLKRLKFMKDISFTPPGFLNFNISENFFIYETLKILKEGNNYPKIKSPKKKIHIEFVSANPTGPLHIGHARNASIGDSLSRIFSKLNYKVRKEYYVNDVGTQVETLGLSVMKKVYELDGDFFSKKLELPPNIELYKGDYIENIAKNIIKKTRNKNLTYFSKEAIKYVMKIIKTDLKNFNVKFDRFFYESSLYKSKKDGEILRLLKNFTYQKDNSTWFKSTTLGDEKDRVLVRSDKKPSYFLGDIAYHKIKFDANYEKIIDIWGSDHHGHVKRLQSALKALNYDTQKLQIILFQFVSILRNGQHISMSTRKGEYITLKEVIDEIGTDATKYFLLTRAPEAHIEFDLELAKKQSMENPVYYIQYAHVRACGILRKLKEEKIKISKPNMKLLKEKEELELMKKISTYGDIIYLCAEKLSPHYLTSYLLDLARSFHKYYETFPIILEDLELTSARVALTKAVRIVFKNGLYLLGISSPEKM